MKKSIYFKLIILLLIFQGCSGDSDTIEIIEKTDQSNVGDKNSHSTAEFDRSSMLSFWADSIILPSIIGFENELNIFNENVENFTANPNANNLALLRDQWLTTYKNWQYVEMFDLGIAEEIYFKNRMNIFPANVQRIESNISNQEFNLDESANFAAQGFTALDYLLFGVEQEDDAILTKYSDTSSNYGDYLIQVTAKMQELTVLVKAQWEGDYRDSFVQSTENTATSSINMMLNDFVYYFEKGYRANKFGIPAGVFSGGPLPNTIEAYHGEIYSKILSLEATNAIENFFNGVGYNDPETLGPSIKDYLDFVESGSAEKLSERINEKLQGGRIKINELNTSFIKQIEENNTLMLLTYDAIQSAVVLFKVDMLQKLNVSVDYTDADGD
ncbi:imelysin family protein [Flavobacteriaceae bacterium]|nr:imelysin family protein [Flavobacteriaceae bacterium]